MVCRRHLAELCRARAKVRRKNGFTHQPAWQDHGAHIVQRSEREGVDVSHVSVQAGATAQQDIALAAAGERIFPPGGYRPGVLDGYSLQESHLQFVLKHNVLASAWFKQTESLFRQVMVNFPYDGWRVADFLDLSDYNKSTGIIEQIHEKLTIAFVSGNPQMVERLRPLSRNTPCLIIVTLGAEGSVALLNGEPAVQPSFKVAAPVDSTGCGDAFQAAFTVTYWNERDVRRALTHAAQYAARVVQHLGAIG